MDIAPSPLEIWKHLAVKLAFNCLSTGTMASMNRVAGNWMSWVSISNKKLIDHGIRLLVELGGIGYEEAAQPSLCRRGMGGGAGLDGPRDALCGADCPGHLTK